MSVGKHKAALAAVRLLPAGQQQKSVCPSSAHLHLLQLPLPLLPTNRCRYPEPAGSGGSFRDPAAVDMIVAHNELVHAMEDQAAEGAQEEERKEESAAGKRLPRVAALAGGRQGGR